MSANAGINSPISETPNRNVAGSVSCDASALEECPALEPTASSQCREDTESGVNVEASNVSEPQNDTMGYRKRRSTRAKSTAVDKPDPNRSHVKCCHSNCNKLFSSEQAMQEHVTSHHGKETKATFKCRLCQISFSRQQAQQRHMKIRHSHRSLFKCPIQNCSESFGQRIYLERHTADMHPGDEPRHMKRLKKSNQTHPPERSREKGCNDSNGARKPLFQCQFPTCSTTFAKANDLKRHTNGVHIKEIVYECTICPMKSYYSYSVKKHMSTVHSTHK